MQQAGVLKPNSPYDRLSHTGRLTSHHLGSGGFYIDIAFIKLPQSQAQSIFSDTKDLALCRDF